MIYFYLLDIFYLFILKVLNAQCSDILVVHIFSSKLIGSQKFDCDFFSLPYSLKIYLFMIVISYIVRILLEPFLPAGSLFLNDSKNIELYPWKAASSSRSMSTEQVSVSEEAS